MRRFCVLAGFAGSLWILWFVTDSRSMADDAIDVSKLPAPIKRKVDFVKDVQPLLRKRCYSCHGPEKQESGFRLDSKQHALAGGDGGKAIVPGKGVSSRLVHLVAGIDEDAEIMPPEGEGTPLTREQVALLRTWIDQGAVWPDNLKVAGSGHWSFQPIQHPAPPQVKNRSWVRNPIDAFIAARHERENIEPSPEARRATLIRRVYLDLLGLPPSVKAVNDFLADERPDAYEQMVAEVLKSEHYGERWGRHWLDLARYADSDGYEKDRPRPFAWRYREWVINALNADMPFDQFTIEQIAGDMLPGATIEQRVASGFHRNTLHNTEGGTDQEEDRVKKTVDRTNTIGTIWLGLTIGCAQCHSHKYDPISQREFYSTYAFFNNINESDIAAPLPKELDAYNKAKKTFDAEHAKFVAAIVNYEKEKLPAAQAAWEKTAATKGTIWRTFAATSMKSAKGAELKKQTDNAILVTGKNEKSDVYTIETAISDGQITAIRLEVLTDKSLAANGPGRAKNGNFVLTTFGASAAPADGSGESVAIEFRAAKADFSQQDWEVAKAINGDSKDGWAVSPQFGKRHVAVFVAKEPVGFNGGTKLSITLDQTYDGPEAHNIGRFRLSTTTSVGPIDLDGLPEAVAKALAIEPAKRSKEQNTVVAKYHRSIDPELAKLKAAADAHAKKAPQQSPTKAQAVAEGSVRETNIHIRGDFLNKGDKVDVKTLAVLPVLKPRGERPDRLDFARWIVNPQNPLAARVTVNRIWQRHFGRGLVATSDDFGSQGERPSHPELLDWLATELREGGWKLKRIHQLIVTSATYRQSSAVRTDLDDVDPQNVLLARQTRLRVEAEIVRDLALAVSGLLDPKIGGPSVRPPQPAEYSSLTYANSAKWQESKGGDRNRRGLYTFFQRTSPYPMLITFDAPDSNECTAMRSTSNTPLQALTLWNDRVFWECAQQVGRRVIAESPAGTDSDATNRARAIYAFQLCLARQPDAEETNAVLELFNEQAELCKQNEERTKTIVGPKPMPQGVVPTDLAGWIAVGRALSNLDEFITRE